MAGGWHTKLHFLILGLAVGGLAGCSRKTTSDEPSRGTPATGQTARTFVGMCDASGAVALSASRFVVADDEDNVLRVYDADKGGTSLTTFDLSEPLGLFAKPPKHAKKHGRHRKARAQRRVPEADIEAATRVGEYAFWLTSHGRNKSGDFDPARLRFFATAVAADGASLSVVGQPYVHLLDDLIAEARFAVFDFAAAAQLAPKEPGGLNIEGMTERVEGGVWLGFRNPLPNDKTLLIPLLNPLEVVQGQHARFGEPVKLDLGGQGVRSLSWWHGKYWISSGSPGGGDEVALYTWDGTEHVERQALGKLDDFNPEAFFTPEDRDAILLLSDDGNVSVDGTECKRLKDPAQKRFRGLWLLPASEAG